MNSLTRICEAAYLLARFAPHELSGWLRGDRWQRQLAAATAFSARRVQGPGNLTLFGLPSASGLRHELDNAAEYGDGAVLMEAKAYLRNGPSKNDVCIFDRKTLDFFMERIRRRIPGPHWRVLASATGADKRVRQYCYLHSIVLVEPGRLPLPLLLRAAGKPEADLWLPEKLLQEIDRLGSLAAGPIDARYIPDNAGSLRLDARLFRREDLEDLDWLHGLLSDELLDRFDQERPLYFEQRADLLLSRIAIPAVA